MNKLTAKQIEDWAISLRYEKEQGSISLVHGRVLEVLERMVLAEARVVELEEQIENAELRAIAEAAADDYYRSMEE